jgi:hypothetical protein
MIEDRYLIPKSEAYDAKITHVSSPPKANQIRFRHHAALPAAAIMATIGTASIATIRWWLLPLLLIPLSVAWWGYRSGTDADAAGLTIRGFARNRTVTWSQVKGLSVIRRGVHAELLDGSSVPLVAVTPDGVSPLLELAQSGRAKAR